MACREHAFVPDGPLGVRTQPPPQPAAVRGRPAHRLHVSPLGEMLGARESGRWAGDAPGWDWSWVHSDHCRCAAGGADVCRPACSAVQLRSLGGCTCEAALAWALSRRSSAGARTAAPGPRSSRRARARLRVTFSSSSRRSRSSRRWMAARGAQRAPNLAPSHAQRRQQRAAGTGEQAAAGRCRAGARWKRSGLSEAAEALRKGGVERSWAAEGAARSWAAGAAGAGLWRWSGGVGGEEGGRGGVARRGGRESGRSAGSVCGVRQLSATLCVRSRSRSSSAVLSRREGGGQMRGAARTPPNPDSIGVAGC